MRSGKKAGWFSTLLMMLAGCAGGGGERGGTEALQESIAESRFSQIVAFGDSLTDGGTYNPSTADADPGNDLTAGLVFTTKPGGTWAMVLAERFGLMLTPNQRVDFGIVGVGGRVFELGGLNYAEGGARITVEPANGGVVELPVPILGTIAVQQASRRSITSQITDYLTEHENAFRDDQLILIQGGANDFFAFLDAVAAGTADPATAPAVVADTALALVAQVRRIRTAGATHILLPNLPDLGATPRYRGTEQTGLASFLSAQYNREVTAALGGSVSIFDTALLLQRILETPMAFGFLNVTMPACISFLDPADPATRTALLCSADTLVAIGADQDFLFADGVHPTAHGHRVWGEAAAASLLDPAGAVSLSASRETESPRAVTLSE